MTSMPQDDHPLHAGINVRLAEIAAASPTPPSWSEAWGRLKAQATDVERIAVYQAVRNSESVPEEAGFFLVAWMLDLLTDDRAREGLRETEQRLEELRQKYGLNDNTAADSEDAPAEYLEALEQAHDAWDALYLATLEEHGEKEMARLLREDEAEFDQKYEAGRQFFHGPDETDEFVREAWLEEVLEVVSNCVEAESPMGPLGLRYHEEGKSWEVVVYPTPVELVGGPHDGEVLAPGFTLDFEQLRDCFDSVTTSGWNALGFSDPEGPHIFIEGTFRGRELFLRILAQAPEDEEPGMKLDAT